MVTARDAVDFCLGIAAVLAAVAASGKMIRMTEEVNARLPAEDQMMEVFWYPGQLRRVRTVHRLFYPKSRVRGSRNFFLVLTVIFLLAWVVVRQFYF
jgi:hypothetical protein